MTIFEDVTFGLRIRDKKVRPTITEFSDRVHNLLKLVQLDWPSATHTSFPGASASRLRVRWR